VGDRTDRALIALDQALCMLLDNDPAAAAEHAAVIMRALPPGHRNELIVYRAGEVAAMVPQKAQRVPEVRALREVLVLRAGERD
jgi:hypothetical protein